MVKGGKEAVGDEGVIGGIEFVDDGGEGGEDDVHGGGEDEARDEGP